MCVAFMLANITGHDPRLTRKCLTDFDVQCLN